MRDYLIENHIWKDQEGKDKFLAKEKKITNEFWINFLGFLGLYAKYKDENKLIQYFKQSTVRLDKVTDTDSDLMVILKVIDDKKVIPDMTMTKITKMLAKIKMGTLGGLDENMFRDEIIKRIKVSSLYPYPQISALLKDFKKGNKTLSDMLPELYSLAMQHKRAHEFRVLYKRLSSPSDSTQDATDAPVTVDTVVPKVSPVKSALTGEPKTTNIPVKTQVIPTDEPKEIPAPTWQDITLYTNANQLDLELSTYYLLMYLVSNSKSSSDIQTIVRSLYMRYTPSRTVMKQFLFDEIPDEIKKQFPTIEKLYTPIKGDFSRLSPYFIEYAFKDSLLFDFRYMVRTLQMKDNIKDLYTTFSSLFIEDLKKYFSEWRGSLKIASKVPDKYIDELDSILKSTFPDCLNEKNIIRSIIMLRGNDFETLIHGIYGDQKIEIVDYLGHFAEYMTLDTINVVISIESRSSKEIAKKWILLDDKKSAAYRWADSMLTFKDKIGDKLSYEILNSELVKRTNPVPFHEFYLKHLKDNNWTLKEYIEHYNLPYSEFIERVKSSNDDIRKYLTLALFLHKEYQADHSYLIEDLALETGPGFKWIDVYNSYQEEFNFVGLYCLNYFAYKGNWTKFAYLVKTIERDSKNNYHPKYTISEVKVIKNIFRKLNTSMPEFLLFYTLLTKLIDDKFDMSTVQNWGIEADFIFKNPDLFIDLNKIVAYRLQNFIKYFENSDYDLSKSIKIDAAIKTIIKENDDSTYAVFSVKDYRFNLKTFNSYKDIWLEHVKYKIIIARLPIIKDFNYLLSKGYLDKAFIKQFLSEYMDDKSYTRAVYDYVYSSPVYEQDDLKKSFALEYFDSKEKINDFLINYEENDWRLVNLNKSGYYTSKKATETIAEYLDRNSFMIGKLYDDYGVDALIEYFKNDNVQGVWDKISSGKRLLNKTNSLEYIMLDMLSDKDKLQKLDDLLDAFPNKIANSLVNTLKDQLLIYPLLKDIFNDDNPLKPSIKLTPSRIKTLLKYNNFEFKGAMLRKKPREKWADYFVRVEQTLKGEDLVPDIKLEKIEETKEQLEEKSVEYSKYYNGNHGNSACEFIESFNVNMKYPQFEQFKTRFGSNELIPAFHASGLTASNFILRFGFTVIPANDSSTVGRMLDIYNMALVKPKSEGDAIEDSNDYIEYLENGYFPVSSRQSGKQVTYSDYPTDQYHWRTISVVGGIYVTNIIEKAIQYLGDDGYSRREGTVGTVYECEVNLGDYGLHHHVAGTGNDSIRSPEWALCWPQAQINIVKAHKVMFTNKKRIKELKAKYPNALKENKYFKRFADYLQEQEMIKSKNVITFVFHQCTVPTAKEIMPWEDFEKKVIKKSNKMYVDSNQFGIGITFHTDKDLNGVVRVPFTDEFMVDDPEGLYSQFLMLVDECKG